MIPRYVSAPVTTTAPEGEVAVREATRADLLDIYRIEQASFPQPWPFQAFERFIGRSGFLVAERGGHITGYIVADSVPNHRRDIGHVKDLAVHPDFRGQGIGTKLLQQALENFGMNGVYSVKLEVRESNDAAIRLYQQHGFTHQRTVRRYYENGEDALIMVRD